MYRKIVLFAFSLFLIPLGVFGQETQGTASLASESIFQAKVIEILDEKETVRENGTTAIRQDIRLKGLEGVYENQEVIHEGISEFDIVKSGVYKVGDRVLVQKSSTPENDDVFYIIDYVRSNHLYGLAVLFAFIIILIGKMKGLKAIISLLVSFFIIIYMILPRILSGGNPLITAVTGSLAILAVIIYLTEGWQRKSHLAILSVLCSLLVTTVLSLIFTGLTRLSGFAQEEAVFLIDAGSYIVDFKGLLLAGMLIGTVGVLDDMIVGQIEAVRQIKEANPHLSSAQIFKLAYKVGNTHLGAIVNTLFLTYTGASLPLLLLFTVKQEPFLSFGQVINNEIVATEIVRSFVGSIGVALSLPISTYLASRWLKNAKGER